MESSKVHSNCWKILTCTVIIAVFMVEFGTAEVQRLYSLGNLTNRSHACGTNEEIILICHGRGSNITWIATTDSIDIGRIIFFNSDPEGTIINQGTIRGLLINTDVSNNLVSELHVFTTPSMRPISITCSSESGRSSHLIAPPAIPDQPIFMEAHPLQQNSNTTMSSILYYLQWKAPSNTDDIDLDHYELFANDTLVQRIHADQRYALITLQEDVTTTVKVVAVNRCGQIGNYSLVTITPATTNDPHDHTGPPTTVAASDGYANTSPGVQTDANMYSGSQQSMASLVILACATFLALFIQGSM